MFENVPAGIREILIGRLELFLNYDRTNQYEKKYELISEYTRTVMSIKTKDEFVKLQQRQVANGEGWRLVSFDIASVVDVGLHNSTVFRVLHIGGTVKYFLGKRIKKKALILEARYEHDNCFF